MTDLEPGTELSVALSQIGADLEVGAEEVAWRGGRRFEHRLAPRPFRTFSERTISTDKVKGYALSLADHAGFEALRWHGRAELVPNPGQIAIAMRRAGSIFVMSLRSLTSTRWTDRSGGGWETNAPAALPLLGKAFMALMSETPLSPLRPAASPPMCSPTRVLWRLAQLR